MHCALIYGFGVNGIFGDWDSCVFGGYDIAF